MKPSLSGTTPSKEKPLTSAKTYGTVKRTMTVSSYNTISKYAYRDVSLSVEERVCDLLGRMTTEEKVAQMLCVWQNKAVALVDDYGRFDFKKASAYFKDGCGLGQVGRPGDAAGGITAKETALLTNAIQKFFLENSRLGIPVLFHGECLHGHVGVGATSFPQPIGLGATFDPELAQRIFDVIAKEARACGIHQALAPVLDVAREPRWGRVEETYGEDPYLVASLGAAAVLGFQGDIASGDKQHVIATLKHFAAHSQPESGTNCAPVNVSTRILREVFLYPFKKAVQEAGAVSVMAAYNEIDGVPAHANKWLLNEVLRHEWGFDGYVVSDYYAITELHDRPGLFGHHVAADAADAAQMAVHTGVNIELPEVDCYPNLVQLVKHGKVTEAVLDKLVGPMLAWKFKLGLFDDPYTDPDAAEAIVGCETHRTLALEAARKTITLLKNDNAAAPLNIKQLKRLAVIGPNADRQLIGGYSGTPAHCTTVLEGIRKRVGNAVEVLCHEGCKITIGGSWQEDEVIASDPEQDRKSIAEAVKVAEQADAVVLVIGGNEQTSREAWDRNHMGDRASLQMIGLQDELVNAIAALGKPVTAVLFNGRPLDLRNLTEKVSTIFECWYLGQEAGTAVAEALFGDLNPGGKLPISIPRSAGHIPAYYNYKPSARRGYLFDSAEPMYPFGFGLSYTQFSFGKPRLEKSRITPDQSTRVVVEVTNTGQVAGDEVVQLYIRDCVSSVTRPVKELKGFRRITLRPGETQTVALDITSEHLACYNIDMKYTVEPGNFEIMVGNSSRDCDQQKTLLTVQV